MGRSPFFVAHRVSPRSLAEGGRGVAVQRSRGWGLLGALLCLVGCSKPTETVQPVDELPSPPPVVPAPDSGPSLQPNRGKGQTKETVSRWSDAIKTQLGAISSALKGGDGVMPRALRGTVAMMDPAGLQATEIHRGRVIQVTELRADAAGEVASVLPTAFVQRMREVLAVSPEEAAGGVRFKLFAIDRDGDGLKTRQRLTAEGVLEGNLVHSSAVVDATWAIPSEAEAEEGPRLLAWTMPLLVRKELIGDVSARFEDVTEYLLGGNPSWSRQLEVGMNTWRRRIERSLNPDFLGYHGLAIRDVDGDGLEDLYLCQPGGLPNLLFRQQRDGTLVDVSASSGVDWLDNTTGALLLDLDNDGDADLALATRSAFVVMANDGTGHFSIAQRHSDLGMGYSPTAADYDLDGDLDLLVLRYAADGKVGDFPTPHPFHSARNGGLNVLLENQGNLRFRDVTQARGLGVENVRFSFAASWEDYDNDGDPDVYIANDFGPNQLFRNEGGRFVDQSAESGTQDWGFGMSATWSDYDRDGDVDLYVSSMFSGAGNQVVSQSDFNATMAEETRAKYLKMVRGNTLLKNGGDGRFSDVTNPMEEGFAGWAWGAKFADLNNDGWEDLYVANGYISQPDTDDL